MCKVSLFFRLRWIIKIIQRSFNIITIILIITFSSSIFLSCTFFYGGGGGYTFRSLGLSQLVVFSHLDTRLVVWYSYIILLPVPTIHSTQIVVRMKPTFRCGILRFLSTTTVRIPFFSLLQPPFVRVVRTPFQFVACRKIEPVCVPERIPIHLQARDKCAYLQWSNGNWLNTLVTSPHFRCRVMSSQCSSLPIYI